ncbi:protein-disulfide reductase DsbD [Sediminicurvatus halobius]|uniref:Thiol:disulfide interchange protein DsbD n=1 Tax=Sediminicurvatus halobius TaxID=2182432 RepID=A0A2U2N6T9_9GAMM|nr:protein-disulfide reductase DsbD [Spiribacter halobius]PWG64911.1 cytochrome C biogenesis protein [Spiribacter halobius]UEX78232.1 protein-disulfide reductase DsbD [Spiribacter halobius]
MPHRLRALVALLCLAFSAGVAAQGGVLERLFGGDESGGAGSVLPVEQAFPLSVTPNGERSYAVQVDVAEGYYLYLERFDFTATGTDAEIVRVEYPPATEKEDEFFGRQAVFTDPVTIDLAFDAPPGESAGLAVSLQGCAEVGVCYPPYRVDVDLAGGEPRYAIDGAAPAAGGAPPADAGSAGGSGAGPVAGSAAGSADAAPAVSNGGTLAGQATGQLSGLLGSGSLPAVLGGFFAAGLLLAFTACLYPMIPILSGLIAGDRQRSGGLRAFALSLVYVEATALTYALAGVAAGLTGAAVQADLQGPWVLGSVAALFVLLALSMFGAFELRVPSGLQTRLTALSNRQRGGTWLGVALMGMLSALIVGACSGPALIAALVFIGTTGDAWLGGLALFTLANGMGLPLLLIGTAAGRWLPRSGPWMAGVRGLFGVGFLAVALWLLERFLPAPLTLGLWGLLLLGCGVWLGGLERLRPRAGAWPRLGKAAGLALVIWGAVALIGAAGGGRDVLQPLTGFQGGGGEPASERVAFRSIDSLAELEDAVTRASAAGRPVLLDVYADWCVYCVQLDERTFTDAGVRETLADAILLRADVTAMTPAHRELLEALQVYLPPAVIFYGPDGRERREQRVVGFLGPERFIERARSGLYGQTG